MPVSKLKNLAIVILLLANAALLCLLVPRFAAQRRQVENLHSSLSSLCAEQNVVLEADTIPETIALYALELDNGEQAEAEAMEALLGQAATKTDSAFLPTDTLRMGRWENGEISLRLQGQREISDQRAHAARTLKSMGVWVHKTEKPVRVSPGIYTLNAVQSVLGVPVFSRGIALTYSNSALSQMEGELYVGTLTRTGDAPCISASEAVVAFLAARVDTGWVGGVITGLEQGYFRAETTGATIRLTPAWKLNTDTGSFLINGLTREVLPA